MVLGKLAISAGNHSDNNRDLNHLTPETTISKNMAPISVARLRTLPLSGSDCSHRGGNDSYHHIGTLKPFKIKPGKSVPLSLTHWHRRDNNRGQFLDIVFVHHFPRYFTGR